MEGAVLEEGVDEEVEFGVGGVWDCGHGCVFGYQYPFCCGALDVDLAVGLEKACEGGGYRCR